MLYLNITLFTQLRNLFYYFFHFVIHYSYRAQLLDYRLLSPSFSASAAYRSRLGKRQQKKPAPQSYLEVKALACPKQR